MQTSQIVTCQNCQSLKSLYSQINSSLYLQIKNKWMNQAYNTDICFNSDKFRKLTLYKRILEYRIVNPEYPSSCISDQDLITQITLIINK